MSAISCCRVSKVFDTSRAHVMALQDITLEIAAGEFVTLVGASGCGKSTLLRLIAGLDEHTSGEIESGGVSVRGPGADRAMVFQNYSLYPWLTVVRNINFAHKLAACKRSRTGAEVEETSARADALLRLMGLAGVSHAYPSQLSGGMQQRAAIARALMTRPRILLMDEPFGALDAQTREVMHDLILHVCRLEGCTVVFVTHDVDEAIYLGDRVVLMAPRPGRIDSIHAVPLPRQRALTMKHSREFLELRSTLLERIRETSDLRTDLELLRQLSLSARDGERAPGCVEGSER